MVLKKQTVWLLTMLTLMVVLSAYYLFNSEPANLDHYATLDEEEWEATFDSDLTSITNTNSTSVTDYFYSLKIDRDVNRARMLEEYDKQINGDATAQAIAEAKQKQDKLHDLTDAELTIETLIKQEGYEEAVVIADIDKVNVVVRSDNALERKQVLTIINLVKSVLKVPGNSVTVIYR